ncbi:sodium:calcium antiporter [Flavilitoribacter nigricans]|jgi:cation:H+ antiporter|uniref:Sodium:calcium exchanger n=1 Tax=Flavilitoribacter nigricans (strain ATCC 23147 / DSM 23189 / NBRC 102662 / NCIMB 1420 / SS-2) TaxID=1122177 RepID=A0A2D0N070_FLAN2|nr:sodium:calcium exchanger [Flavilitoribacter nigricans]PHN01830.1 sodium:calcium exchanger [Flavilitoribacter nigricans DSM 23189 = NBRC 102662]
MNAWLWAGVLLLAAWAAHWGANQLLTPLKLLRKQWGLTASAGAAFLAIVTASPEVAINITSAARGVSDIGLGNLLGSNIISIPLMITIAYFASRKRFKNNPQHQEHLDAKVLALNKRSVSVLSLPYLGIIALVAILTIPKAWRGLQPVDGWIMLGAYAAFLARAIIKGREKGEKVEWTQKEIWLSIAGAFAIAAGAFFIVKATENIVSVLSISKIVGGLFITGIMTTAPEVFKTWSVVKGGEVTAGTTSVIADNAITMTVAFFPLALVNTPVQDFQLYWVNLAFVGLMPLLYSLFVHQSKELHGFSKWQVFVFDAAYLTYLLVMAFFVLELI